MFLPVILMRDYGPWSFAVFAIPNVIGAALMGVVLMQPGASAALAARHRRAIRVFSWVTVAFQTFFGTWLLLGSGPTLQGLFVVAGLLGISTIAHKHGRRLAILIWTASIALVAWWLLSSPRAMPWNEPFPSARPRELLYLIPLFCFGFGLCPYLDATFHRALQRLPGWRATFAFALGFGILFAAMIVVTFLYAPELLSAAQRSGFNLGPQLAALPIVAHIALQLGFTIGVHESAAVDVPSSTAKRLLISPLSGAAMTGVVLAASAFFLSWSVWIPGFAETEIIYRMFMSYYALVAPAYVWLCMIPTWRSGTPTTRHHVVFGATVGIAAPMFGNAFFNHQEWWLLPGLGVVLLARLLIPRTNAVEQLSNSPMQDGRP